MTHAKTKGTHCKFCTKSIERFEPVVVCKDHKKVQGRTFTRFMRFHPACWLEQGMVYLSKHPPVVKSGRPRLQLSSVDKVERTRLLRRHAVLMSLYRAHSEAGRLVIAVEYYLKAFALCEKIEPLGGVPKAWRVVEIVKEESSAGTGD